MAMHPESSHRRKGLLIFLLILVPFLFFLGWSQASLNLGFIQPSSASETIFLFSLSILIFLAFVIFALILSRILLKLYAERRHEQLGSRFKTKMVVAFLGLSLVPVCFLFAFAYGLLNRSIDKWFGIPFDTVRKDSNQIVKELEWQSEQHILRDVGYVASSSDLKKILARGEASKLKDLMSRQQESLGLDSVESFDARGRLLARAGAPWPEGGGAEATFPALRTGGALRHKSTRRLASSNSEFFLAAQPVEGPGGRPLGTVVGAVRLPDTVTQTAQEIQREARHYDELSRERKAVKRIYLSMLWLLTLLILFVAAWFALFLSKQVTVPIQALAEGTREVSRGNLGFQVMARSDDELGILIESFNQMTRQLLESRQALEQAALDLRNANRELEERGNTIEAILQNIPAGVISFDAQGRIDAVNAVAERMFHHKDPKSARTLSDLLLLDDAREVRPLFRRAERQGVVSRQMELDLGSRRAFVAITVSSIRSRHRAVGSVMVLEDLSELLRAQNAAAWREVAQRLAHEIKNPLTPIQLSTQRIQRLVDRANLAEDSKALASAVAESTSLIACELAMLKTLVDEFSDFARFPASHLAPSQLNSIVEDAVNVFNGRLDGIMVHRELAPDLPVVQADPEQLKRALVNLIDNAAEALEQAALKEIWVRTSLDAEREVVELVVADSGPGFSPEAKEKLFLPYFSTKRRGTGLGLAIVSRIVSEHNALIRVEDNKPTGAKFIIELPVEHTDASNAEP